MSFTVLFIVFGSNGVFSAIEGIILLVLFFAYLLWLTRSVEHSRARTIQQEFKEEVRLEVKTHPLLDHFKKLEAHPFLVLALSAAGLWLGAHGTVEYATTLAHEFGVSQAIIGSTIIAIGTSLPNILVALSALKQHLTDVFLGSIIGANIATFAMVGGISMLISPMQIPFAFAAQSYGFLIISTALLFFAAWLHSHITKSTALVFMGVWLAFLVVALQLAGA
jgi:cation:H+ antiporter